MSRSRLLSSVPLLSLLVGLALAGCGHGGGSSAQRGAANNTGAVGSGQGGSVAAAAPSQAALQERQIVRTATVQVTVSDVDRAAQAAVAAATAAGGRVDTDDRSTDDSGGGKGNRHAHLVLRVPSAGLDGLLDRVVALGTETNRSEQATDSTSAVADVNARVAELQISVSRLQDFLRRSGRLADLLALESQLTQRQSELESTVAQQRALTDQVGLATLTVEFAPPSVLSRSAGNPPGFLGALGDSWHALLLSGRLALALLGYLAPFLLIAAAAGYGALRLRRSHRSRPDAGAGPRPDAGVAP
jgi:Domain of unknown function (DUF4349)